MAKSPLNDVTTLTFEQAMGELETIVSKLEAGQIELEKAIESYTRGTALKTHCEKKLLEAKLKIEKMTASEA